MLNAILAAVAFLLKVQKPRIQLPTSNVEGMAI